MGLDIESNTTLLGSIIWLWRRLRLQGQASGHRSWQFISYTLGHLLYPRGRLFGEGVRLQKCVAQVHEVFVAVVRRDGREGVGTIPAEEIPQVQGRGTMPTSGYLVPLGVHQGPRTVYDTG